MKKKDDLRNRLEMALELAERFNYDRKAHKHYMEKAQKLADELGVRLDV